MGEITENPKTWPAPNYDDPQTLVGLILAVTIASLILMEIFIVGRIWGRAQTKARIGWDDWTMIISAAMGTVQAILVCLMTKYGAGYHLWDIRPDWPMMYSKLAFGVNILFTTTTGLTKVSICITYLRLFPTKLDKYFCYTMIAYCTGYLVSVSFGMAFQCTPVAKMWNPDLDGHCINFRLMLLITGILNSISDCLVFLWPIRALWGLQLPTKQKVGLVIMFGIGSLVCVAGIIRLWYVEAYFENFDAFYGGGTASILTSVESNFGVLCGCIPGIKPLLHMLFPRFFSTYGSEQRTTYGHGTYGKNSFHSKSRNSHHLGHGQNFPFQTLSGGTHGDRSYEASLHKDNVGVAVTNAPTPDSASDIERDAGSKSQYQYGHEEKRPEPKRSMSGAVNTSFARAAGNGANGAHVPDGQIGVSREVRVTSDRPRSEDFVIQGARK